MNELSRSTGSTNTTPDGASHDFNSDDAFCGDISDCKGPRLVEIMGMDLLSENGRSWMDGDSDLDLLPEHGRSWMDGDGDLDYSDELVLNDVCLVVNSSDQAVKKLSYTLMHHQSRPNTSEKTKQPKRVTFFPDGEVDSLFLTRERLPHIARGVSQGYNDCLDCRLRERKELTGEADSLILHRRRLPHIIHKRETPYADTVISWKRIPTTPAKVSDYMIPLNDLSDRDTLELVNSVSSTYIASPRLSDLEETLCARSQAVFDPTWKQSTGKTQAQPSLRPLSNSMLEETSPSTTPPRSDVGEGFELRRVTPGACAA
jgi:hypothetical protein